MLYFKHKVIIHNSQIAAAVSYCRESFGQLGGLWKFDSYGPSSEEQLKFEFALEKHAMFFGLKFK